MRADYIKKCAVVRNALDRINSNKLIKAGPFISALKYVLEIRLGRYCTLYSTRYGEADFTVHAIRFKLKWMPLATKPELMCKHLEGDKYLRTMCDFSSDDPLMNIIETIEYCIHNVTPFGLRK